MIRAIVTLPARLAAHELFQNAHGRGDFGCPGIPKSEDEPLTRVQEFPARTALTLGSLPSH